MPPCPPCRRVKIDLSEMVFPCFTLLCRVFYFFWLKDYKKFKNFRLFRLSAVSTFKKLKKTKIERKTHKNFPIKTDFITVGDCVFSGVYFSTKRGSPRISGRFQEIRLSIPRDSVPRGGIGPVQVFLPPGLFSF